MEQRAKYCGTTSEAKIPHEIFLNECRGTLTLYRAHPSNPTVISGRSSKMYSNQCICILSPAGCSLQDGELTYLFSSSLFYHRLFRF